MNNEELANYRAKLFRDETHMLKAERVPHASHFLTWKILDAGYTLSEALNDWSIMSDIQVEHQKKYNFDAFIESGNRNNYRTSKAMGSSQYKVDDELEALNYIDGAYCEHDELREFMADPVKFKWEKGMGRKYPFWNEEFDISILQNAIDEQNKYINYSIGVNKRLRQECGLPTFVGQFAFFPYALSNLMGGMRGMKGTSIDMHRDKGLFDEIDEYFKQNSFLPALKFLDFQPNGENLSTCFDAGFIQGAPAMLNPKQIEKYVWPYFKASVEALAKKGWTVRIFLEGAHARYFDMYNELPGGVMALHIDKDDIFEARAAMPNHCLCGGTDSVLLGNGTVKQCIDQTKRLIDELGSIGGFILSQDKLGSYRADGKSENVKAVCDFALNYVPSQN